MVVYYDCFDTGELLIIVLVTFYLLWVVLGCYLVLLGLYVCVFGLLCRCLVVL